MQPKDQDSGTYDPQVKTLWKLRHFASDIVYDYIYQY